MPKALHITAGDPAAAPDPSSRRPSARRAGSAAWRLDRGDSVVVDLDGVLWRGNATIPRAAGGVQALREGGVRVVFFTNNSYSPVAVQLAKLREHGVEATPEDLLTSSQAAAALVEPGERVLAVGGPGLLEALDARGAAVLEVAALADGHRPLSSGDLGDLGDALERLADAPAPEVSTVVVGIDPGFDYRRLAIAALAVRAGARLVATNADATYPVGSGVVPGAGAGLAAVAVASGATPVVAGKPNAPAAELVHRVLGSVQAVIGDRPDTDGAFAERIGAPFALVLSGVTPAGHGPLQPEPDLEAADLGELADLLLGR